MGRNEPLAQPLRGSNRKEKHVGIAQAQRRESTAPELSANLTSRVAMKDVRGDVVFAAQPVIRRQAQHHQAARLENARELRQGLIVVHASFADYIERDDQIEQLMC